MRLSICHLHLEGGYPWAPLIALSCLLISSMKGRYTGDELPSPVDYSAKPDTSWAVFR